VSAALVGGQGHPAPDSHDRVDGVTSPHRPGPGRVVPTSTYRLQLHAGFGFDDAASHTAYLASLGVSHLYLSPILESTPGSTHGYDVLDHTRIDDDLGGREAFDRLVSACREQGLGLIVDVVPNHMTVPRPTHLNAPFWSLLRDGRNSPYAVWFDVDWAAEDDRILMPVLGGTVDEAINHGDLVLAEDGGPSGREWVLWHHGDEFPVAPGTQTLPLRELVEAQAYRLSSWREAGEALNYRRFFDVTSLVAVRVEDPIVFAATHATLLALFGHGAIDGFRIDHPDGLADPSAYLAALADATGDAWVVVEKILEDDETLLDTWRCVGTTGYDSMLRIQQVLTSGVGTDVLDCLWAEHAGSDMGLESVVARAKRLVIDDVQAAEVDRLVRLLRQILPGADPHPLRRGLEELLIAMDRYRAYVVPGEIADVEQYAVIEGAEDRALAAVAARAAVAGDGDDPAEVEDAVRTVAQLVRGGRVPGVPIEARAIEEEFRVRFQQTCGPVMAKGIEDTAFYRWLRLAGANEVGGHPEVLSIDDEDFHAYCARQLAHWPTTMTALTTHDTKRSEDVRARLMTIADDASGWDAWVHEASRLGQEHGSPLLDPATEYLIWQTLVGAWPMTAARLEEYVLKAIREAKTHTAWVDGDPAYEEAVVAFARGVVRDEQVRAHVESWIDGHAAVARANVLSQKVIQLAMPGVPDVYQGTELELLALVDPDNRRPVNYEERLARLARLDEGEPPADLNDEKLLVTSTLLRLRRDHPSWFVGDTATYAGWLAPEGVLAFVRGDDTGPQFLVAAAVKGAMAVDRDAIDLPIEGTWRLLWSDTVPVLAWVRDE